jgi:hypothetical protein
VLDAESAHNIAYFSIKFVAKMYHRRKCPDNDQGGIFVIAVTVLHLNITMPNHYIIMKHTSGRSCSLSSPRAHALLTKRRGPRAADLVVEMPAECLHAKDFLNHRYRLKRALYLLELRRLLDGSPLVETARSGPPRRRHCCRRRHSRTAAAAAAAAINPRRNTATFFEYGGDRHALPLFLLLLLRACVVA